MSPRHKTSSTPSVAGPRRRLAPGSLRVAARRRPRRHRRHGRPRIGRPSRPRASLPRPPRLELLPDPAGPARLDRLRIRHRGAAARASNLADCSWTARVAPTRSSSTRRSRRGIASASGARHKMASPAPAHESREPRGRRRMASSRRRAGARCRARPPGRAGCGRARPDGRQQPPRRRRIATSVVPGGRFLEGLERADWASPFIRCASRRIAPARRPRRAGARARRLRRGRCPARVKAMPMRTRAGALGPCGAGPGGCRAPPSGSHGTSGHGRRPPAPRAEERGREVHRERLPTAPVPPADGVRDPRRQHRADAATAAGCPTVA